MSLSVSITHTHLDSLCSFLALRLCHMAIIKVHVLYTYVCVYMTYGAPTHYAYIHTHAYICIYVYPLIWSSNTINTYAYRTRLP